MGQGKVGAQPKIDVLSSLVFFSDGLYDVDVSGGCFYFEFGFDKRVRQRAFAASVCHAEHFAAFVSDYLGG